MTLRQHDTLYRFLRRIHATVYHVVAATLALVFVFGSSESHGENYAATPEGCFTELCYHRPSQDIPTPFDSNPTLPGGESREEKKESKEELDSDEDDTEHRHRAVEASFPRNFSETLRLNYRLAIQNHTRVSLIILYHSWKGYLS